MLLSRLLAFAMLASSALLSAPVNFTMLQDRTWTYPGETIGTAWSCSEVSWAYDQYHKKFVRFGGCTNSYTNEVFAYYFDAAGNFVSEQILAPGATDDNRPGVGCSRGICYDSKRHIVWGYGGIGAPPQPCSGKNWALMGLDLADNSFRMAPGSDEFALREVCQIEYGAYQDAVLLVGKDQGSWHQTWLYEFSTSKWRQIGSEAASPELSYLHPCYDEANHAFVLLVGSQTWVFNPSTMTNWDKRSPSPAPSARTRYGMAYDSNMRKILLFGGRNGETDTWAYDVVSNLWTLIGSNNSRTPGVDGIMPFDYDSEHNVFVGYEYGGGIRLFRNTAASRLENIITPSRASVVFPNPLLHLSDLRIRQEFNGALYPLSFYNPAGRLLWNGPMSDFESGFIAGKSAFSSGAGVYLLRLEIEGKTTAHSVTVIK